MKNLKETKANRIHNLIIVDESGSMNCIRKQAFTHSFAIDEHMMFMQAAGGRGGISIGGSGSNSELTNWDGTKKKTGWGVG